MHQGTMTTMDANTGPTFELAAPDMLPVPPTATLHHRQEQLSSPVAAVPRHSFGEMFPSSPSGHQQPLMMGRDHAWPTPPTAPSSLLTIAASRACSNRHATGRARVLPSLQNDHDARYEDLMGDRRKLLRTLTRRADLRRGSHSPLSSTNNSRCCSPALP